MPRNTPPVIQYLAWSVLGLALANVFALWWLINVRESSAFVHEDLLRCQIEASQIAELQKQIPAASELENSSSEDEVGLARAALQQASIDERSIQSISVMARTPIKKTAFERVDTSLTLKNVDLAKVLQFIDTYERTRPDSICSQFEFRVADGSQPNASQIEVADLTLTQLVKSSSQ